MSIWALPLLLALGSGVVSTNGQPVQDEDYEKAVNACAVVVFAQQLKNGSVDYGQQGEAYDAAYKKCRKAIGSLMEQ